MKSTSISPYIVAIIMFGSLSVTGSVPNWYLETVSAASSTTIKPMNNSISVLTTTEGATFTIITNTTTNLFTGKVTTNTEIHSKITTPPGHNNTNTGGSNVIITTPPGHNNTNTGGTGGGIITTPPGHK